MILLYVEFKSFHRHTDGVWNNNIRLCNLLLNLVTLLSILVQLCGSLPSVSLLGNGSVQCVSFPELHTNFHNLQEELLNQAHEWWVRKEAFAITSF